MTRSSRSPTASKTLAIARHSSSFRRAPCGKAGFINNMARVFAVIADCSRSGSRRQAAGLDV